MRKPAFCICENKDTDQLRDYCRADLCLCFPYTDGTVPLLPKSEISSLSLAIICGCSARFVSDLVGGLEDRYFHNETHMLMVLSYKILFNLENTCLLGIETDERVELVVISISVY